MLLLAIALLTAGTLLGIAGTAGFYLVATTNPATDDLGHLRALATLGRRATASGLLLLWTSHTPVSGLTGLAVTLSALALAATYLTKAHIRIPAQTGAAP